MIHLVLVIAIVCCFPSLAPVASAQGRNDALELGEQEKATVVAASKQLLTDLCAHRSFLCLSAAAPHQ